LVVLSLIKKSENGVFTMVSKKQDEPHLLMMFYTLLKVPAVKPIVDAHIANLFLMSSTPSTACRVFATPHAVDKAIS
jgi:hypothetical protein